MNTHHPPITLILLLITTLCHKLLMPRHQKLHNNTSPDDVVICEVRNAGWSVMMEARVFQLS